MVDPGGRIAGFAVTCLWTEFTFHLTSWKSSKFTCSSANNSVMNDLKRCKELRSVYFAHEAAIRETQQSPDLSVENPNSLKVA